MKKVGHTGTLDPEVTGVLPVVVGEGTKLSEFMQTRDKSYSAEVTLGRATDTEDAHGETTEVRAPGIISDEMIDHVLNAFKGSYRQQVPLYSSVKVDGRKLYEYARKNQPVERPVKTVFIKEISRVGDIVRTDSEIRFKVDVTCSKGTYIRTLAVDIGRSFGVPAHMSDLVRTGSCGFGIEDTVTLDVLAQSSEEEKKNHLKPVGEIIKSENLLEIGDAELLFKVKNGQKLNKSDIMEMVNDKNRYIVFMDDGVPIGMYHQHPSKEDELKPYRMFNRL